MNNLKSIQPISLAEALGLPKPEIVPKAKPKVKKAVTKLRKGFSERLFLGIPFTRNAQGKTVSEVLDYPLEDPKNMQQCYRCDEKSEQPHYKGKVQRIVYDPKSKTGISVPPNCPYCNCTKMGAVKEDGVRLDVTRDDGSNILNIKKSYLIKNSNMSEDMIDQIVMYDESDGTMEAFDNALPMSLNVKYGYKVKEDEEGMDLEALYGDIQGKNMGSVHNKSIKDAKLWLEDYLTRKATLHQFNTCKKWFRINLNPKLSYYQVEKLMKAAFWEVKQYKKAVELDQNQDMIAALEKIDIFKTKMKSGHMFTNEEKQINETYKKDYEKETMDREFKSLVLEKELGVNVELLDTYKIAKMVELKKE